MMNENEIYSVKLPWFGYIHYMVRFRQKKNNYLVTVMKRW